MAKTTTRMISRAEERKESAKKRAALAAEREAMALQSAPDLTAGIKARAVAASAQTAPETLGRCITDGEPTSAKHGIVPVADSIRIGDDGASWWGVCPACGTNAKLHSVRKVMNMHVMRGENLPASKALSEPEMQPTDTGAVTGDPAAGSERRGADIDGAWERGEVSISRVGDDGKRERVDVPATLENLQEALRQEIARRKRLRSSDSIKVCDALVIKLRRMVKAAEAGKKAMSGPSAEAAQGVSTFADTGVTAGQRGEARTDGAALVQGRTERTLTHEEWQARQTGRPGPTTLDAPVGRERVDAGALGAPVTAHSDKVAACAAEQCAHIAHGRAGRGGYLTYAQYTALPETQRRRYRANVATNVKRAERADAWTATRQQGKQGTGCTRAAGSLLAAPSREQAEIERLMQQAPGGSTERVERIASRG